MTASDQPGSTRQPTAWSQTQEQTWQEFLGLSRELFTALERQLLADAQVSVADVEIMEPLLRAGTEGLRVKELATACQWQDSRVSHQLRRMEKRGLIERERDPLDGRGTVVHLSDAGRTTAANALDSRNRAVHHLLFRVLTPAQQGDLTTISQRVRAALPQETETDPAVHFSST